MLLGLALLLGATVWPGHSAPRPAAARPTAPPAALVMLIDSSLDKPEITDGVTAALRPHAKTHALQMLDIRTIEGRRFAAAFDLRPADTPVLFVMSSASPSARITRRIRLNRELPVPEFTRSVLAGLRLPLPQSAVVKPVPPGVLYAFATDGGPAERPHLATLGGAQRVTPAGRELSPGGAVTYRLRLPGPVRAADLRLVATGPLLFEWADRAEGPWGTLLDLAAELGPAARLAAGPIQPVLNLKEVLARLPGDLYLRARSASATGAAATLGRLELVVLRSHEESAAPAWVAEAQRLQAQLLAGAGPGLERAPRLGGTLTASAVLAAARSPFLVTANLVVPAGMTLTVEPGVTLRISPGVEIRAIGLLRAEGTLEAPITFAPLIARRADDWAGITFITRPGENSEEGSLLRGCRILNAAQTDLPGYSGLIEDCIFENCAIGLQLRGGAARVVHNTFRRCRTGVLIDGSGPEIVENLWEACLTGLQVTGAPAPAFRFERNSLRDTRLSAVNYLKNSGRPTPPLVLANNHWSGTAPERMTAGGAESAVVRFDPRLGEAPATAGSGLPGR